MYLTPTKIVGFKTVVTCNYFLGVYYMLWLREAFKQELFMFENKNKPEHSFLDNWTIIFELKFGEEKIILIFDGLKILCFSKGQILLCLQVKKKY